MKLFTDTDAAKKSASAGKNNPRLFVLALLCMALIVCALSCTAGEQPQSAAETEPAAVSTPETTAVSDTDAALAAYRDIIAHADTYAYGADPELEAAGFSYALVMMQSGDAVPTLLISQQTAFGTEYVRVFRYDTNTGTVLMPVLPEEDGPIMQGAASAGGFRGTLYVLEDGSGLCEYCFYSTTGEGTMSRVSFDGGMLALTELWSGGVEEEAPFAVRPIENWYDVSDLSGLAY